MPPPQARATSVGSASPCWSRAPPHPFDKPVRRAITAQYETDRSRREKTAHPRKHSFRLLEMRQVRGLVDQLNARAGNRFGEVLRIGRRDDAVLLAPDDQRRCRNTMNAMLQAAIRDRPD